jgi:hypothetical protein
MIDQDITEREELAADTLERLREALSSADTPSVARIIDIIRQMSNKADVLSIQDLAEAIGHDLTTMVKVMKAANCLQFNPSALEVSTVARAVSVIGFNKIQNLALSLLLLEGAENRVNTEESRDVSARALCSALIAEEVTRQHRLADPDEAFVSAALRSYGRLLLSTFLLPEYREAQHLAQHHTSDRAFRLTFGLTPLEVSQRILGDINLAGIGTAIFRTVPSLVLQNKNPSSEEGLLIAAEFGSNLADLVSRPDLTPSEYACQSELLLDRYRTVLGLDRDALTAIVESVRTRLDDFGRAQEVDVFSSVLMQRLRCIAADTDFAPTPIADRAKPQAVLPETLLPSRGPLAVAVKRIKDALAQPPIDSHAVLTVAVAAIRKAMRLESCVVFVRLDQSPLYAAHVGEGPLFRQIEKQSLIDPARRDVFTVCLSQGEDVLIQDPAEGRIAPFIPAWFQNVAKGAPFLLLPLKDAAGVFGIVCGVAPRAQRIELGVTRLPQFRTLRKLLAGQRALIAFPLSAKQAA